MDITEDPKVSIPFVCSICSVSQTRGFLCRLLLFYHGAQYPLIAGISTICFKKNCAEKNAKIFDNIYNQEFWKHGNLQYKVVSKKYVK